MPFDAIPSSRSLRPGHHFEDRALGRGGQPAVAQLQFAALLRRKDAGLPRWTARPGQSPKSSFVWVFDMC